MTRPHTLVIGLLVVLGIGLTAALLRVGPRAATAPVPSSGPPAADVEASALAALHTWDAERSAAYAAGSAVRLRALYLPGSAAGAADVRLLRAYAARGLRVHGMRTQVLALAVRGERPDRWQLVVTDRLSHAVAVRDGHRSRLPRDAASTREVTMMLGGDGRWQVSSVVERSGVSGLR